MDTFNGVRCIVRTLLSVIMALGAFAWMIGTADAADLKSLAKTALVVKIEVEQINEAMNKAGLGFETDKGEIYSLNEIQKRGFKKTTIKDVLQREQIELKNGEVIYPEEVKYGLIFGRAVGVRSGVEKAPHEDDGAGGKDKAPHLPE